MRVLTEKKGKIVEARNSFQAVYTILAEFLPKRHAKEFAKEITDDRKFKRPNVLDKYLKKVGIQAYEREEVVKNILSYI